MVSGIRRRSTRSVCFTAALIILRVLGHACSHAVINCVNSAAKARRRVACGVRIHPADIRPNFRTGAPWVQFERSAPV